MFLHVFHIILFFSEGGGPLWKPQKCWFFGQESQKCRHWLSRRTCMWGCYETFFFTFLYIKQTLFTYLLSTCLTDSGGREWQDSRRQIQNIWLWLSHCFQLTGHRVGEGEIGESLWLRPLLKFTVSSDYLIVLYIYSPAFLPTFQCSLFCVQIDEALKIKNTEIAKELCLPPVKLHCSSKCIKMAVWDRKHVDGIKKTSNALIS